MTRRMLFKIGVTVVIGVGIFLFYSVHVENEGKLDDPYSVQNLEESYNPLTVSPKDEDSNLATKVIHDSRTNDLEKHAESRPIPVDSLFHTQHDVYNVHKNDADDNREEDKDVDRIVVHLHDGEHIQSHSNDKGETDPTIDKENLIAEKHEDVHKLSYEISSQRQPVGFAVHLCVVSCGNRTKEVLTMLKSAIMTTPHTVPVVFHIITESDQQIYFKDHLEFWPRAYRKNLSYKIYNVTFPEGSKDSWRKLFKPCAAQRLFLPSLLETVDSLIYVDTDVLFLRSVYDLWSHFYKFNSTQLVALVPESEDPRTGWYNRFATHPYYGELGVNSGVMLMNLTRLRTSRWESEIPDLYDKYRLAIPWGDQDLINIYFAKHPDELFMMGCEWNYRSDHCKYQSVCQSAERHGVAILHGSKRAFLPEKQPAFAKVYDVFHNHRLGDNFEYHFLKVLEEELKNAKPSVCGKISDLFLVNLRDVVMVENKRLTEDTGQVNMKIKRSIQNKVDLKTDASQIEEDSGRQKFADTVKPGSKNPVSMNPVNKKVFHFHRARDITKLKDYSQYDDDSDIAEKVWDMIETL